MTIVRLFPLPCVCQMTPPFRRPLSSVCETVRRISFTAKYCSTYPVNARQSYPIFHAMSAYDPLNDAFRAAFVRALIQKLKRMEARFVMREYRLTLCGDCTGV